LKLAVPLPLPVGTYVNTYPLFVPLATEESSKHAELDEGIAGGTQLLGVPPSLSDGKFAANPTVYVEE